MAATASGRSAPESARVNAQRGPAPAHRAGAVRRRHRAAGDGARRPSCAARTPTRGFGAIDVARGAAAAGRDRGLHRRGSRRLLAARAAAGAAAAGRGHGLPPAHAGAARQGQGPPRRRADRPGGGREPLPRRGRARARSRSTTSRCPRWSTSKRRSRPAPPLVHEDLESNLAAYVPQKKGDYEAAQAAADLVIRAPLLVRPRRRGGDREPRRGRRSGTRAPQRLTVWDTTQAPIPMRNGLAAMLGLSEHQVRLVAPFIGGGFGPKIMMFYPEEVLIPWLAMRLGRPVKWIEDRAENFVATTQERGQIHDAEIALDRDGTHPRRQGLVPPRHRRLRPLRPDRAAQQPVHAASGPYRVPAYAQRVPRRLHQQDRSSRPTAAPAGSTASSSSSGCSTSRRASWASTGSRSAGATSSARRVPARPRDHLPGLRAAHLRQRQLRAGPRRRARRDRLRRLRARGAAARCAPEGRPSGSASSPTSRAPASARSRARGCRCRPSGKVTVVTGVGTQGQGHFTVLRPDRRRAARACRSPTSRW